MRNTPGGSSGSELRLENFARYEISQQNSELPLYASDQDNPPLPTILKDFQTGSLFYCRGEMRNTPGGSSGSELRLENFVRYEISQQNSELPLYASDQDNPPLPTILKDFRTGSLFLLRRLNNCYFILR